MAQQGKVSVHSAQEMAVKPQIAEIAGPVTLEIRKLYTTQLGRPDNAIMRGENFTLVMEVAYSTLLGDLGSNFVAKFHVINMDTGTRAAAYSAVVTGALAVGAGMTITYDINNAQEEGVFLLAGSIGLPRSLLNDFSLGETVGPPNNPVTLKIANFFVHPPTP